MSTTTVDRPSGLIRLPRITSVSQFLVASITLLVTYAIAKATYRLYFHPLRKFPGPKLRAASRIQWHIATWTGSRDHILQELHAKYGHIVRVNPDELSFTDPNAWKDIYGHFSKSMAGSHPEKDWQKYGKSMNGSTNLLNAYPEDHSRMRKIFNPAFSDRALKQQEPLFVRYADLLALKLREGTEANPDTTWDMVKMYNFTTFDVMGDITFGESLHMLENEDYDPWVKSIFKSLIFSSRMSILMNYSWFWVPFRALVGQSINRKRMEHFNHSVDRVTKRLEKGRVSEGVDLWDLVLGQTEGKGLTRAEMDANSSIFMVAGTETTATLLSGLTYYLLINPISMEKAVTEIRNAFASTDDMTMERLAALPYLGACIKEAFRLYPPVPLGMPRVTATNGSTIAGQLIPPNTPIAIPQHVMYTHPKNFSMPLKYIPERWLGDKRFENDARHAVQPFSVGTRDCVGKNMAYHEMRLIIAKVLYQFDLELCPESRNWQDQDTHVLWQKKPLMCKLTLVD